MERGAAMRSLSRWAAGLSSPGAALQPSPSGQQALGPERSYQQIWLFHWAVCQLTPRISCRAAARSHQYEGKRQVVPAPTQSIGRALPAACGC
jgi:hypothetical protein